MNKTIVKKHIAIVTSQFNSSVTQLLYQGAKQRLLEHGMPIANIVEYWVPGAVEIPLIAQQLAKTKRFAAIICLGAVIRGETTHYDYVCQQVSDGCQRVALDYELPVIFGILTTESQAQAYARTGGTVGHKGREAADAALDMIMVLEQIKA